MNTCSDHTTTPQSVGPQSGLARRVTQGDIARAAGVHNTTVSLALRNSPAIPESTRRRIKALAEQMGYSPDPALRALVAYRNSRMVREHKEVIAYLTNAESRWAWRNALPDEQYFEGAARKAAQYGYQLEHFWLGEPGMTQRRISDMLFHRGITGVLLASQRVACDELLEIDWSRISAVRIGCVPHVPALHRVTDDQAGGVRLSVKKILAAGYRRVGLVLPQTWDDAADQAWSTGFLVEQNRLPREQRLPILAYDSGIGAARHGVDSEELGRWIGEFQPDVLLSSLPFVGEALTKLGLSVPGDIALADVLLNDSNRRLAGLRNNSERVGEVATEMLVGQMQQNLFGVPEVPTLTLVEGAWCEGESLPGLRKDHVSTEEIEQAIESAKQLEHVA